ncbi:hypothetical protein [Massilia sp. Se16.2.3]|uniref:hypothetical protein n=1 Tax=Massilia sp. Se16.2.3 TaxID=2709303 RepID=UPI001601B4A4|nr:hypothetical protein [Massilia sp. Se16.2.3]QNB00845.1 hypothetical protein G4G31_21865 [Massilia sp. Se16.2.3]
MVSGSTTPERPRAALAWLARAFAFPVDALPALVLAWLCLRIAEAIHASSAGVPQATLFGAGLGNDLLSLLRRASCSSPAPCRWP